MIFNLSKKKLRKKITETLSVQKDNIQPAFFPTANMSTNNKKNLQHGIPNYEYQGLNHANIINGLPI